jgi:hypothetical protein
MRLRPRLDGEVSEVLARRNCFGLFSEDIHPATGHL